MDSNASRLASLGPMSARDQLYRSESNKTFENEPVLPSLPVPDLKNTLDIYLDTVRPVTTEDEFRNTETIVKNFYESIGPKLQESLLHRAKSKRNWVKFVNSFPFILPLIAEFNLLH